MWKLTCSSSKIIILLVYLSKVCNKLCNQISLVKLNKVLKNPCTFVGSFYAKIDFPDKNVHDKIKITPVKHRSCNNSKMCPFAESINQDDNKTYEMLAWYNNKRTN